MLHRQHNSYAQYTACLHCIYAEQREPKVYTNSCSGSQGRAPDPISLHFVNFPAYARIAQLSLPHIEPVLSSVVACLPYLAMVMRECLYIATNNACFTTYNTLWLYGECLYYRIVFYKKRREWSVSFSGCYYDVSFLHH